MQRERLDGSAYAMERPTAVERSTAELTGDLVRELTTLVHDELALARVEMTEKGKRAGVGAGMFGAASLFGFFAFACVTTCLIAAISLALPVWVAALIVGAAYLIVGAVVAAAARVQLRRAAPPVPTEALESTKENVAWLKRRANSARR